MARIFPILLLASLAAAQTLDERRQELKAVYHSAWGQIQRVDREVSLEDVARIRFVEGRLRLTTNLPAEARDGMVRLRVKGKADFAAALVHGDRDGGPLNLQFIHEDYSQPDFAQIATHVNWNFGNFNLYRVSMTADGFVAMTFGVSERQTHFSVVRRAGGAEKSVVNLTGPDIAYPRVQSKDAVNRYLRPLLSELALEALLAPEPRFAHAVFADEAKASPAVEDAVRDLLPALDADEYRDRQTAAKSLKRIGLEALPVIRKLNRNQLSAGQNAAIDAAFDHDDTVALDHAAALKEDPDFLLDCLYCGYAPARACAVNRLEKMTGRKLELDPNQPAELLRAKVESLRAGLGKR